MKNKILFLFSVLLICFDFSFAQALKRCATDERLKEEIAKHPELSQKLFEQETALKEHAGQNQTISSSPPVVTIPVVVHVVYHNAAQNISDAQIYSQMAVLNADYRRRNLDSVNTPTVFKPFAADCEIAFQLAMYKPDGSWSNGITRDSCWKNNIGSDTAVYYSSAGGSDIWDPCRYYNIWVCQIGGGILGITYSPVTGNQHTIGSIIDYKAFGTTGTVTSPYDKGRTVTHESGHFLSLLHPFGTTGGCYDADSVTDTPQEAAATFNCPAFPHTDICSSGNGVMFQDFMGYADDACMNLFTNGQKTRMQNALNLPQWVCLKTSNGIGIQENSFAGKISVFPNPANDLIHISLPAVTYKTQIALYNLLGSELLNTGSAVDNNSVTLNFQGLSAGTYFIKISSGNDIAFKKIIKL